MKTAAMALMILSTVLAACGEQAPIKGEKGDAGPPGQPGAAGPPGPPGPAGAAPKIRFSETACQENACIANCNANERILSAYVQNGAGNVVINDPRRASYRPARATSGGTLVLVCISQ